MVLAERSQVGEQRPKAVHRQVGTQRRRRAFHDRAALLLGRESPGPAACATRPVGQHASRCAPAPGRVGWIGRLSKQRNARSSARTVCAASNCSGSGHVQPVELQSVAIPLVVPVERERVVIVVTKCLATLCRLMTFPTRKPISAAPRSGRFLRGIGARSSSVSASRGLRHTISRVAGDLGEVPLVEQRAHRAGGQQFADHRRAQRGDPAQAVHARQVLADARRGACPGRPPATR